MKNTFKVRFDLRKDKQRADGKQPIYFYLTLNGKQFKLSSGQWLDPKDWDIRNRQPKTNFSNLRRVLNKSIVELEDFFTERNARSEKISPQMIKDFYNGFDEQCFYNYYARFLEIKKTTEKESTIKSYVGTLNSLKQFRKNVKIGEIDIDFIKSYDYFLRVKKGMAIGGAWARHKNLKTLIRKLITDGLLKTSPYGNGKFEVRKPETKTVYLDQEEIERIIELRDSFSQRMQVNVDRFIFSCFTGFRYSDMNTVKWSDVKIDNTIKKKMVKVSKEVIVPISPRVEEILERYKGKRNDTIFPPISNDKINKALRTICKVARIDKKVSFHASRHSFGYILGQQNVNAFKIMTLMGHSDIKQTKRYVSVSVKDLTVTMNNIDLFSKAS